MHQIPDSWTPCNWQLIVFYARPKLVVTESRTGYLPFQLHLIYGFVPQTAEVRRVKQFINQMSIAVLGSREA